ncbi:hypothetical protein [Paenibacillus piri]|uniref:DUF2140 family protein n=1 Tax=Paenibacillus piri TaxID=2547395 RepID=A0A4R5KPL9_9BACL|nr:hypothetical protein [Paenibacillus piri]TDF97526.1 hypothetical protein E1757_12975 [Paenibacillus piri]
MGKLIRFLLMLALAAALLAGGLYLYAQPQQTLDLNYSDLSIKNKLADMIASRKLEVELTEPEVNNLLKKALAKQSSVRGEVEVTGARFTLNGSEWIADVNLLYQKRWQIGAELMFAVSWQEPYVTVVHTGTRIRQAGIPSEWFRLKPLQVPLNDYMPKLAGVKSIDFLEHGVRLKLGIMLH